MQPPALPRLVLRMPRSISQNATPAATPASTQRRGYETHVWTPSPLPPPALCRPPNTSASTLSSSPAPSTFSISPHRRRHNWTQSDAQPAEAAPEIAEIRPQNVACGLALMAA
ncbi:hypothetical protein MKEN_00679000 [Mycena kentingensis (nom. inval.)]|nr:hypothetical protein MKEN_00679000 [Mycena kentingensis (nom. inval.)]